MQARKIEGAVAEAALRLSQMVRSSPPTLPAFLYRLILIVFVLAVAVPGLFSLPPGDRDESRFAQATKQMTETGDYVRILNGTESRNKKPIGIHWLQAPFVIAVGPHLQNPIWPYRIPSILGGMAAVLAVFETGLLLMASAPIGALAGAMLAGSVIFAVETHIAKTDAALLGATTIAMAILARAWMAAPVRRWQAALFWLAAASGILLKGPITPMVLVLTCLTLCVWERRTAWVRALQPGWGVPLMLLAVLPWFVAIGMATHGQFFTQAVGGDLGRKLAGGAEAHGGFPGLHLLLIPLLAFPSTLPVLWSLPGAWFSRGATPTRFLLAWLGPSWLVFEAVPTKLPHYTLPLYPALFLLAASFMLAPPQRTMRWLDIIGRIGLLVASAVLGLGAAGLPFALKGAWWLGLPALAIAALTCWLAWTRRFTWALVAAPLLYAAILQFELPSLPALWIAPRVEQMLRTEWPGWNQRGQGLVVAGYAEPSLMFLAGTAMKLEPDGVRTADALADGTASLAIVGDRDMAGFDRQATALGLAPRQVGQVRGFNYSRGRWVTLGLMVK